MRECISPTQPDAPPFGVAPLLQLPTPLTVNPVVFTSREIDVPNLSYIKIGESKEPNDPNFTDLQGENLSSVPLEYSEIQENKIVFGCVFKAENSGSINEIGIFNNNDEMFARAVLEEEIIVEKDEYFHLYYELEI